MINCIDCKYYSSNPYLRCAVNPTALGGCEMGEVREPLKDEETFPTWPPELYIDWHNGERINVNELTGIDRDLVLMGIPVAELEETKRGFESLGKTGIDYEGALSAIRNLRLPNLTPEYARQTLNNLGRLP